MITREIKLPENYKQYFKTENDITNLLEYYIETREELEQDKKLKEELSEDKEFLILNKMMEEKLGTI